MLQLSQAANVNTYTLRRSNSTLNPEAEHLAAELATCLFSLSHGVAPQEPVKHSQSSINTIRFSYMTVHSLDSNTATFSSDSCNIDNIHNLACGFDYKTLVSLEVHILHREHTSAHFTAQLLFMC